MERLLNINVKTSLLSSKTHCLSSKPSAKAIIYLVSIHLHNTSTKLIGLLFHENKTAILKKIHSAERMLMFYAITINCLSMIFFIF